jgi:anaerobic magnesium-protoporphyrin IX monomethyl ester cyclase
MYVTPHAWTEFGRQEADREVVEPDQQKWDYRHPVLAQEQLRPWQLFVGVKWLELCFHLRPRRLWAVLRERDRFRRWQLLWVFLHIGLVWVGEVLEFLAGLFRGPRRRRPPRRHVTDTAPSPPPRRRLARLNPPPARVS